MFENITTNEIVFLGIAAFVLSLVILHFIIQGATKSKSILKLQRMQVELLKEIAIKNQVDPARVNEIIEEHNTEN